MESDAVGRQINHGKRVPLPEEVMTIREVAALLKLAEKTVYSMANASELPAFKIRGQWRIRRADIDRWIENRIEEKGRHG